MRAPRWRPGLAPVACVALAGMLFFVGKQWREQSRDTPESVVLVPREGRKSANEDLLLSPGPRELSRLPSIDPSRNTDAALPSNAHWGDVPWAELEPQLPLFLGINDEEAYSFGDDLLELRLEIDFDQEPHFLYGDIRKIEPFEFGNFLEGLRLIDSYSFEDLAKIQSVLDSYRPHLEFLGSEVGPLVLRSLREYILSTKYIHVRKGEEFPSLSSDPSTPHGILRMNYNTASGGWRIRVEFDSIDYPDLEGVLREGADLKNALKQEVLKIFFPDGFKYEWS